MFHLLLFTTETLYVCIVCICTNCTLARHAQLHTHTFFTPNQHFFISFRHVSMDFVTLSFQL